MKNITFIGISLIFLGIIIILISFALINFDFSKFNTTSNYTYKSYENDNTAIDEIDISLISENVIIKETTEDKVKIEYYQNDKNIYNIIEEGNKLTFKKEEKLIKININFFDEINKKDFIVYLPTKVYKKITVSTISGNITMENISSNDFNIKIISGKISTYNLTSDNMKLSSISGENKIKNNSIKNLTISSTSGKINFENLVTDNLSIKTISSDIEGKLVNNIDEYTINISTISGKSNIKENNINRKKTIAIKTTSGDINIK